MSNESEAPQEAAESAASSDDLSGSEWEGLPTPAEDTVAVEAPPSEEEPEPADRTYAEVDRLIAEETAPQVDDERAAARQAADAAILEARAAAVPVSAFAVTFDGDGYDVTIEVLSTDRVRAELVARRILRDLADSEAVSVEAQ